MVLAIVAAVLTFTAISILVGLIVSRKDRIVEGRLHRLTSRSEDVSIGRVLREDSGSFPFLRGLTTGGWARRARKDLAQAGSALKVSEYLVIRLFAGSLGAAGPIIVTSGSTVGIILAIVGGFAGYMALAWIIGIRRARRQAAISAQLAETLSLISNSLRSGFAFTQSVELATRQISSPIKDELEQFLRDASLGSPTDEALQEMVERTGSYDLDMIVSSILIQRSTGGNLSEILDNVAATVRERERLQGEIRALTASQRFTGMVLSIYPVGLGLLLAAVAPSIWKVLITEEAGRILLVVALALQIMGAFTIRRILKLEV